MYLYDNPLKNPKIEKAVSIWAHPDGLVVGSIFLHLPEPDRSRPTVLTKEGYAGASRPQPNAYLRMDDGILIALRLRFGEGPRGDYAFVQASIRGTNCSGGQFNLYDRRHAWDGHHIVEWIAAQDWSNGRVGMFGSSYPGQTAYWVASTRPPTVAAMEPNATLQHDVERVRGPLFLDQHGSGRALNLAGDGGGQSQGVGFHVAEQIGLLQPDGLVQRA